MKTMKNFVTLLTVILLATPTQLWAAIGCTLSNPAQDLKYLFPEMTSYKEEAREFDKMPGGETLFKSLRARLGSDLDPVYETYETPYTVYRVFQGETLIGIVHGVNVPGKGGVIQVFASLGPDTGEIKNLFFQRLESPAARALKSKEFRNQFTGLTLGDFYKHDYYAAAEPGSDKDRVAKLAAPGLTEQGKPDFEASLRGVRKNLILADMFAYGSKFEPYYLRAQEALAKFRAAAPGTKKD